MKGKNEDEKNKLIDIDVTITQAEFTQLLEPIVNRVSYIAKQILHEIRFEPELIDTVLMVGGSSLVPAIQNELKNCILIILGKLSFGEKEKWLKDNEINRQTIIIYSIKKKIYLSLCLKIQLFSLII